jgi:hypothetical protein
MDAEQVETLLANDGSSGGPIDRPAWDGAADLQESPSQIKIAAGNWGLTALPASWEPAGWERCTKRMIR